MRKLFTPLLVLLLSTLTVWGQSSYQGTRFEDSGNPGGLGPTSDTGGQTGWTQLHAGSQSFNAWSTPVALPFAFEFFGHSVTQFSASLNGLVTFNSTAATTTTPPDDNTSLPSALLPDSTICGFWDAFTNSSPTGFDDEVSYQVFGTVGSRQLWIRWYDFEMGNPSLSFYYFAVVLEEGTNNIYFVDQYSSTPGSLSGTLGMQLTGSLAYQFGSTSTSHAGNGSTTLDNDYVQYVPSALVPNDIGAVDLFVSGVGTCFSNSEEISVEILNYGTNAFDFATNPTTVTVNLTGGNTGTLSATINSGSLAIGAKDTILISSTVDLSMGGVTDIEAYTTATADVSNQNDSTSASVTVPASVGSTIADVDFDGFNGSNLNSVFPQWDEANGLGNAPSSFGASSWGSGPFGNDATNPNGTSARINLWATFLAGEWMVGPIFTPQVNTVFSFDLAVTQFGSSAAGTFSPDDSLKVLISTDCGASYTTLGAYGESNVISNTGQTEIYDLSAYAGQKVQIAFYADDGTGFGPEDIYVYIDNINVKQLVPVDAQMNAFLAPGAGCLGNAEEVTVRVENVGSSALDFTVDPMTVSVDITGPTPQTFSTTISTGTLAVGGTFDVNVTNAADLSAPGTYDLVAYNSIATDGDLTNDTTSTSVTNEPSAGVNLNPVDFTGYNGINIDTQFPGWTEWEGVGQPQSVSNFSSWTSDDFGNDATSPNGTAIKLNIFSTGLAEWFLSPKFTATTQSKLVYDVVFTEWANTNPTFLGLDDTVGVYISADCGQSFQLVRLYDNTTAVSNTGQSDTVDLAAFNGQDIIVGFYGTTGPNFGGDNDIMFDNINIKQILTVEAQASAIVAPASAGCLGTNEDITIQVTNVGAAAIDFAVDTMTLNVDVAGPTPQSFSSEINSGVLPVGVSVDYVVTSSGDFSVAGTYTITGSLSLDEDIVTVNDTTTLSVTNEPSVGATVGPVDFVGYSGFDLPTAFPGWKEFDSENGQPTVENDFSPWTNDDFGNTALPQGISAKFNIFSTNRDGWIISPKFTPDTNSVLLFDIAMTQWNNTNAGTLGLDDSVGVYISTDCGANFVPAIIYDVNTVFSTTGETDTVDLNGFTGQDIIIGFYATSGPGFDGADNDVFIDNINIKQLFPVDLSVSAFPDLPTGDLACSPSPTDLTVTLTNGGLLPIDFSQDSATVVVEITGPVNQQYTVGLNTGIVPVSGSLDVLMSNMADFSAGGVYDITSYVFTQQDGDNGNDTLTASRENVGPVGVTLPVVDFTGYNGSNLNSQFAGWAEWEGQYQPQQASPFTEWVRDDYDNDTGNPNGDAARINLWNLNTHDWIISPKFSATSRSLMFYDIAITPFATANTSSNLGSDDTVAVYISTDCGVSFQMVKSYVDTTNIPAGGRTDSVDLGAYAGQDIQVAFYATEGLIDDAPDNDIFIDNVNIGEFFDLDAIAVSIDGPEDGICGDSMTMGSITLQNGGFVPLTEIPYTVEVTSAAGTETFVDTLVAASPLQFGDSDVAAFGPFNSYEGGEYTITLYTQLTGEENGGNDTLSTTIKIQSLAPPVVEPYGTVCIDSSATLVVANPNSELTTYEWITNVGGVQTVVGKGNTYETGALSANTTYTIREVLGAARLGEKDTTIGGGGQFDFTGGLEFDAITTFTLKEVTVFPKRTGAFEIALVDANLTVLQSKIVNLNVTNQAVVVELDFVVPPGTGYGLAEINGGLYRNFGGASYPYVLPGVVSITNTLNDLGASGYYYFFYDWLVESDSFPASLSNQLLCGRPDGEVTVEITKSATSSFTATAIDDNQVDFQDLSADADSVKYLFGDGDSTSMGTTIHTYPAAGNYTITQIAYSECGNDTTTQTVEVICTLPVADFTWALDPSDPDNITVQFTSNATRADSISYELFQGATSDLDDPNVRFPGTGIYVVNMTVFNACGSTTFSDTLDLIQTGLEGLVDLNSVQVYPNPSKGEFTLSLDVIASSMMNVEIVDMRGRILHRTDSKRVLGAVSENFDLSDEPDGIYLVKILVGNEMLIKKIAIE
ncbi:MAG: T9SS type A sorting domain-containing protein [Bacteroidota bacterium]